MGGRKACEPAKAFGCRLHVPLSHREWNRLMHIMHGNTAPCAAIEVMCLNVRGMMVPLQGGEADDSSRGIKMIEEIEAYILLRRKPALIALQECGGGWAEMRVLVVRLQGLGYACEFEPGELAASGHDKHRRGGVLLGWLLAEFRVKGIREAEPPGGLAEHRPQGRRVVALVSASSVNDAETDGEISATVARELERYAGRRALAVLLTRTKGPRANEERVHGVVYVPSAASDAVRAAFIREVGKGISRLTGGRVPFTLAGDWQGAPFPSWRVAPRPNKVHETALRDIFFGLAEESVLDGVCIGRPVAFNLDPDKGQFSFHAPNGFHATLDHIITDFASAAYTWGDDVVPPFLGSRTGEFDEFALFDHRVLVARIIEGHGEVLGRQRPKAERLRGSPREIEEFLRRLPTEVDLEDDDDVSLGKL